MDMTTSTIPAPAADASSATPTDLIGAARSARARRERAEHDALRLAREWAVSHEIQGPARREQSGAPGQPGEGTAEFPDEASVDTDHSDRLDVEEAAERRSWRGLPQLRWDCAAPFAAALGRSTRAGWALMRQALTLSHRLPRTQTCWEDGRVETRAAQHVADAVAGQPDDVCAWIDLRVADRIRRHASVGQVVLERLLNEALTELHAEALELEREEQLHARYARVVGDPDGPQGPAGPGVTGLAEFVIRGDWPDVKAFNDTIAALAEAIRRGDGPDAAEPLDVRRSIAVGILADPLRAAAMLGLVAQEVIQRPTRSPRQQVLITFHLAADAVSGAGLLRVRRDGALVDRDGRPWLGSAISEWMGRPDVGVVVRPAVHCGGCAECDTHCDPAGEQHRQAYEPTDLDRERVALLHPRCVFPHCTMPARHSDCDHIVPFDPEHPEQTPTCPRCNLAPLCRHHHRLKTHSGWAYRQIEPGVFTWTEPHGQSFVTSRWGTRDTTDPPRSSVSRARRPS